MTSTSSAKSSRKTKRLMMLLAAIALGSIAILITYFLWSGYHQKLEMAKNKEFEKLGCTVNGVAQFIDGDSHEYLIDTYQQQDAITSNADDSVYNALHQQLDQVRKANKIDVPIYTLVMDEEALAANEEACSFFGVTSSIDPYFRHPYTPQQAFIDNYQDGGELGPYADDHGTWLSAFAPIYNSDQKVVGVVEADIRFDAFMDEARKEFQTDLTISLSIFLIIAAIFFLVTRIIGRQLIQMQNTVTNSLDTLNTTYASISTFAGQVGRGNLDATIDIEATDDQLVHALISMRDNLRNVKTQEEEKNWIASGVQQMARVMSTARDDNQLYQQIIAGVVKYLNCPMGILYTLNEHDEPPSLVVEAQIGHGELGLEDQKFGLNQGLVGRAFSEREKIIIDDLPDDYTAVISGLGAKPPKQLLLLPLMLGKQVEGVIEVASLTGFDTRDIEFMDKVADSIATTIFRRKSSIQTLSLLKSTKLMNEDLEKANTDLNALRDEALQAKEEAISAKDAAEKASRVKSEFLANMSHELRTPLNGVIGYAQILMDAEDIPRSHRAKVQVINNSGEHLLGLINNVLDISKIEAGRQELHVSEVQLKPFVEKIISMLNVNASKKNLRLNLNLDNKLPKFINADSGKLRQCIINLIGNAIKFTDEGGVILDVRREKDEEIGFYVIDSGRGIPQDKIEQILEPFAQVHDHGVTETGTGLGLTITRSFIQLMGGDLQIESTTGKGSTFSFVLPLSEVEMVENYHTDTNRKIVGYKSDRTLKVLVVDDIAVNRDIAADILTKIGFEVVEATNGKEGLSMAEEHLPDLLLADVRMPVMDGIEMIQHFRKNDTIKHIPVFAMTASAENVMRSELLSEGFNDFIAKPFRVSELLEMIATRLGIKYTYEEGQITEDVITLDSVDLGEVAAVLPSDFVAQLEQGISEGDLSSVQELIDALQSEHPMVNAFRDLVSQEISEFNFDSLELLLGKLKGE